MRKILLLIPVLFNAIVLHAQSFTGTGGTIPGTNTTQTCFPQTVSGVGIINGSKGLAEVCITLTHPNDDELEILLTAPDGTVIPLTIQNGGTGNNYTATCFSATATNSIKFGTAPFSGSFLPEGHLGAVNNGQNANGTWRLCIQDRRNAGNSGTLSSWTLTFNNTPAPLPPALPTCSSSLPSSSSCSSATSVCDFNGLCGSTSGSSVQDWTGSGLGGCFGLQNNSFIKFVAAGTSASFSVWVPTNTGGFNNGGIQMLFFSGTCNAGAVTTYGCYPHIFPYTTTGVPLVSVVTAQGLTPGNTYYLMIDGFNNDICTFTIAANSGVNILDILPANPSICAGQSVSLNATGGNGSYSWSPAAGLSATTGAAVTASPSGTTTYTVTSATAFSCPLTKDVTVSVNPLPTTPVASVTAQPGCIIPTGTISITSPTGPGLEYSVNGSTYQSGTIFTGLAPATYNVIARNTVTGCSSQPTPLTVNTLPIAPLVPTATVTVQPTCSAPAGTIVIIVPLGANLEYSVDGSTYLAGTTFTGLAPGNYSITARNSLTGCVSPAASLSVNAVPTAPASPAASVTTQPSCSVPTGTITINSPTGAIFGYSIDGINYQTGPVISGLTPANYNVTVRNIISGCVSPATALSVNAAPVAPSAPTATVTAQPTCLVPTGTILITAPVGANLEYSINGSSYQAATTFNSVAPGGYNVTVRNIATGCVSAVTTLVVDAVPTAPATPTASVTVQPTCSVPTGTISITAPIGANLEYSINGSSYQVATTFSALAPATYTITTRNTVTGCISTGAAIIINVVPPAAAGPAASVTAQPSCTTPTGTIAITAPTGPNIEYSINGSNYQTGMVFSGLAAANYNVTFKNTITGCISLPAAITVNVVPAAPATPTGSVTVQPTCNIPTGTITITAPLGASIEYSIDGIAYQPGTTFTGVVPGDYDIAARNTVSGCISAVTPVKVNPVPAFPAPAAFVTSQPSCTITTGTITVIAPLGPLWEYSLNGSNYQGNSVFSGLTPNTYNLLVRNSSTGCISSVNALIVDAVPGAPAAPTASVVSQPTCVIPTGTITVTAPNGPGLEYNINGGSFQAGFTFSNLAPANYEVKVRNTTTGCVSLATMLTVNAVPANPTAPSAAVTVQPTCSTPTGTINITAPTGVNFEYSINGSNYMPGTSFGGLAPANYNVTVRSINTGCVSPITILTVNAIPTAGSAPSASVTAQPTCTAPTGTVTITAPTGTNFEYSVNGFNYQAGLVFSGLAPSSYNVTTRNITTGCVSSPITLVLNAVPSAPPPPNASVTVQPTCIISTGTITITDPIGANFEYSVNGTTFQAVTTFTGLAPTNYTVLVRNTITGCSAASSLTVSPVPPALPIPTVNVTAQPTCTMPTGTLTITAPTGTGLQYSINGITYQNSATFSGLTPAAYTVFVKNSITGCVSPANIITVNAAPVPPAAPTASVTTQPSCPQPTGTITITAPVGNNFEYSKDGVVYKQGVAFTGLSAGNFTITVRNITTGCISPGLALTVNSVPGAPAAPAATVTVQPSCSIQTGTITVSTPTGINYSYSVNGTTYQAGLVFTSLAPSSYNVRVKDTINGCVSPPTTLIVNAVPAVLPPPTATTVQPSCTKITGSMTVVTPAGPDIRYSIDGVNYQASTIFSNIAVPTNVQYSLTARNVATGCISPAAILTFDPNPGAPAVPVVTVTQPTCSNPTGSVVVITPIGSTVEYSLAGGNYQVSPSFTGLVPNTYQLVSKYLNVGCPSQPATFTITALSNPNCGDVYFPSAFSPNSDGLNDEFGATGNTSLLSNYVLTVFNRYGEIVFTTTDPAKKWNGYYKGKMIGNTNYVWQAKYRYKGLINKVVKGNVSILK